MRTYYFKKSCFKKIHFLKQISLTFAFLLCLINPAKAALINTEFSELVGNQGTVDITLSLSASEVMNGLSLYFSEALFADLAIVTSPAEWDSIVIQPDVLLGAGFFDSFNIDGLTSGFARISFTWLAAVPFESALQVLEYEFYNADFEIIDSGVSTAVAASVPESSPFMLLMMGLVAVGLRRRACNTQAIFQSRQSCTH